MKNILASDYVSKLSKVFTKENSEKMKNSEIRKFEQLENSIKKKIINKKKTEKILFHTVISPATFK